LPLEIVWTAPGWQAEERALHVQLAEYKIRGEWFDPHPDVWDALKAFETRAAA
jgi:hypothetical protein